MTRPGELVLLILALPFFLGLASCGRKAPPLYHDEVNVKSTTGGKDLAMTFDEVERHEKYSIVKVRHKSGASVPSIMFVTKGFYRMAELRGVGYFVNLKEWIDEEKNWVYKEGFSADKNVDARTYFGGDVDLSKDLSLCSVRQFDLLFRNGGGEESGKAAPATKERLPEFVRGLDDPKPLARCRAADSLGAVGPEAREAVPALIKALGDPDPDVRSAAAEALGKIGPDSKEAVPALIKAMSDLEGCVRKDAAFALCVVGPEAGEAVVPVLTKALGDPDKTVRMWAAMGLGGIGREAREAIPALIKNLGDTDVAVRISTADALGRIGPDAKDAVSKLQRLAEKDPVELVRQRAGNALEKIKK